MPIRSYFGGDLLFLTWIPHDPLEIPSIEATQAYQNIAETLDAHQAVILQERIFGEGDAIAPVLDARNDAFSRFPADTLPPTVIEGLPLVGSGFAGTHIIAARKAFGISEDIVHNEIVCGRIFRGQEISFLSLADVSRQLQLGPEPKRETRLTFAAVEGILDSVGWGISDIRRTWFYLRDILDWYDGFNGVRNEVFDRHGLYASGSEPIPASTGISGCNHRGSWCTLDLLAMRARNGRTMTIDRLNNPRQNEAPEYGSAFSRGLNVKASNCNYVFVSGTASIDDTGLSTHPADFERQAIATLETVTSLLAAADAELVDICQATAFVKRHEDAKACERVLHEAGLDQVPTVCTIGDVCREDLLFELDATAMVVDEEARKLEN
ncbi:MAG: hypothetical protein GY906_18715 [bacterium]|nr:hypothetical protein [bacterium]